MSIANNSKEDFFADIDKLKHKPSFSCGALVFFLLFLLAVGGYIVFWSISQIKAKVEEKNVPISELAFRGAESKLQSLMKKGSSRGQRVDASFTDQELSSLLVKNEILASNDKYALRNPQAVIMPEALELSATLVKPLQSNITATTRPYIENGQIRLEVKQIKAGKLILPKIVNGGIKDLLERVVADRLNNDQVVYDEIVLGRHLLTISGHTK